MPVFSSSGPKYLGLVNRGARGTAFRGEVRPLSLERAWGHEPALHGSADCQSAVSRIGNPHPPAPVEHVADCQSATQQVTNLRYTMVHVYRWGEGGCSSHFDSAPPVTGAGSVLGRGPSHCRQY